MAIIVFDVDGVLIRSRNPDKSFIWSESITKDLPLTTDIFLQLFQFLDWLEIIEGKKSFKAKIDEIFEANSLKLSSEDFIRYWLKNDLNWNLEVFSIVNKLKTAGHFLLIATNQDEIRSQFLLSQDLIRDNFFQFYSSSRLGISKPSLLFFQKLSQEKCFKNSDVIFIDDDLKNIESAQANGWQIIHYNPDIQAEHTHSYFLEELKKLNL